MNDLRLDSSWQDCDWVVFDAVGTLIQPTPSVAEAYHSIAARRGSRFSIQEVGDRFRQAFRQSEQTRFQNGVEFLSVYHSNDSIELARWRWIVGEVVPDVDDQESCFSELWEHFARPSSWTCFDDVGSTLTSLQSAGYRLAIASNFDSRLHPVCDGLKDLKPIERRFVSSETGYRKPAAEFYANVIARCGGDPSQIVMIGDDHEHDVAGPRAAGMRSLMLDRRANSARDSLRSLHELFK